ncbi:MAG: hypothetical protein ACHQEB_06065 [Chitinophagales bacterium]
MIFIFMLGKSTVFAQDNSPYSRYGLGDLVSPTNVTNRGMGGLAAGYSDILSINFNNPASYSLFQSKKEQNSKKLSWGRALLDLGLNFDNRTLHEQNVPEKFIAKNALFSYLQLGVPLKSNWGLSFGLRPISRISYKINRVERLIDPISQQPIDSALTEFSGDGGASLATIGTGYKFNKNFSAGFNVGYLFGKKDYATKRAFINDTVDYEQSNHETKTSYGNLFFNAGIQYFIQLNKTISMTWGAYGNWNQKLNASQDIIRETFLRDPTLGDVRLDSVSEQLNIKGKIIYPASYGVGFVTQKEADIKKRGWQLGIDFTQTNWSQYRYYGQSDSVQNKWELRVGGQSLPATIPASKNYWSAVSFRAGFFIGPDYIRVQKKLPQFGASFGMGLPFAYNRLNPNQATVVDLAFEYIKRGNNSNLLRENLFRVSVGFSLSDLWFLKRKYD